MKGAFQKGSVGGTPSPAAAELIQEYSLENEVIPATGKNRTITKKDVQKHIKANQITKPLPTSDEEE